MPKSSIQRIGKGCSGCAFNIKQAKLKGGYNKTYHHVCSKKSKLLNKNMRISDNKYSCFVGR